MNLLLDTNVLIDYIGGKQPFFDDAQKVIAASYFGDAKLWVSTQSLKDAYYVLSRYADQMHVQRAIRNSLEIMSPVALSAEDTVRGLYLQWEDYEDCLIALCAVAVKADYIITRDEKGFTRSTIPALSPAAWLALMKEEHKFEYDLLNL